MGFRKRGWLHRFIAGVTFLLAGGIAAPLHAADDGTLLRIRAQRLALDGSCVGALPLLEQAAQADPRDARAPLLAAECWIRLGGFAEAEDALREASQRDPQLHAVHLPLAVALYHQEKLGASLGALEAARPHASHRAEFHVYRGLLWLAAGDPRAAALAFEAARRTGPDAEPAASYYSGLAWARSQEGERARHAFERVVTTAPDSSWADRARAALAQPSAASARTAWIEITAGLEYDDNVLLKAGPVALPAGASGQDDVRAVWRLAAGSEFWNSDEWSAGTMLSYSGQAHRELDAYDLAFPAWTLWLDRRLAEGTTARLRYDLGYARYGGDAFLLSNALTPTLFQEWGRAGSTHFFARLYQLDHFNHSDDVASATPGSQAGDPCPGITTPAFGDPVCGPAGLDEHGVRNQDGKGFALGAEHLVPLGFADTALRGGYEYQHFGAEGKEYSFNGHALHVGSLTQLPWSLGLETRVGYTYRPYRHASSYPDPRSLVAGTAYSLEGTSRRDRVWRFGVELARPLSDRLSVALRYQYDHHDSNVTVFDYDRGWLGAYLTVRLHK